MSPVCDISRWPRITTGRSRKTVLSGVDDDTWMFHLRKEDYSEWFKKRIKDPDLAAAIREIEKDDNISPEESRKQIREKIEERYTKEA